MEIPMVRSLFAATLTFLCATSALAQQLACPPEGPAVTVVFDNDARGMTLFRGSDNNYTTGIRISVSLAPHDASINDPDRIHRLFPFPGLTGQCHRTTWSIGESMYTPTRISDPNLIPNDRPYAGWAYLAYGIDAYSPNGKDSELFEINIGAIGPMTGGRAIQTWVNENISNSPIPKGWSHQLLNSPGAYAFYQQKRRVLQAPRNDWGDFAVHWGGALGNVVTYPSAGAILRLGYHVSATGPVRSVANAPANLVPPAAQAPAVLLPKPFSAYIFVQGSGRLVFRNVFLDGGSFADEPHTIKRKGPVADVEIGFVMRYRDVTFTYRTVGQTHEFNQQNKSHYYGSIGITFGRIYIP
jgi:lipid A 3-O-deacylase